MARLRADSSNNSWATHETGLDGAPFWKHFQLAEKACAISNADAEKLFKILADWETVLQAQNIDFDALSSSTTSSEDEVPS